MSKSKRAGAAPRSALISLASVLAIVAGCADDKPKGSPPEEPSSEPSGPFKSMTVAANAPESFTQPRAGVPLDDGSVAFIANVQVAGEALAGEDGSEPTEAPLVSRVAVLVQKPGSETPSVLYAGDRLVNPFDIDVSLDQKTLFVADAAGGPEGEGAILALSVTGGEPSDAAVGHAPHGVTVAHDGSVYFSGVLPDTGEKGVFRLVDGSVSTVFAGAPFVDPSGIAVTEDDRVFVADTRLFDNRTKEGEAGIGSEAGIVLIDEGKASVFVSGFSTGYPAGIALTTNEKALIISGEGPDRSDTVYIYAVEDPAAAPTIVTADFSRFQDSSAGLKRAHGSDTFIWASLSVNGGTVYQIIGN